MTAPALALAPVAPAAPDVGLVLTYAGPAVPSLLRVCQRYSNEQPVAFEHSVPTDARPCLFCDQPIKSASTREGVGIAVSDGEFRWCHVECRETRSGRIGMSVRKSTTKLPDCKNCGEPFWDGHMRDVRGAHCDNETETMYEPTPDAA